MSIEITTTPQECKKSIVRIYTPITAAEKEKAIKKIEAEMTVITEDIIDIDKTVKETEIWKLISVLFAAGCFVWSIPLISHLASHDQFHIFEPDRLIGLAGIIYAAIVVWLETNEALLLLDKKELIREGVMLEIKKTNLKLPVAANEKEESNQAFDTATIINILFG